MLKSQHRLRKMKDFDILFKEGKFFGGKYITAKVWKIKEEAYPRRKYSEQDLRIGVVVSKKVHKSAVKRNRIKRQLREVIRLLVKADKLKEGFHIAIMAKPDTVGTAYDDFERDIEVVLQKARVLK